MRLVHDTIILYYDGHESKVKARGVLKQYQKYLDWQEDLPDDVEDIDDDDRMVPDVLSLQSCSRCPFVRSGALTCSAFNTAPPWVLLFRPLLHSKALPQAKMDHLRALTVDYAWQGLETQRRYRRLFTRS
ncbi:hypothetical protein LPUS_00906 [Lasallia pustulata]|uniref:Uncharacterized protein n=1 Tax=Lasallia pustulata TaxID=136370 RepID=A0A1W5D4L3_9LECA|nr:hypothetical protein LPUS_00906 [Lasallia pustulata]